MAALTTSSIRPGRIVEVWNRSLGHFGGCFQVEDASADGIHVRSMSESTPLPVAFTPDEVRLLPPNQEYADQG